MHCLWKGKLERSLRETVWQNNFAEGLNSFVVEWNSFTLCPNNSKVNIQQARMTPKTCTSHLQKDIYRVKNGKPPDSLFNNRLACDILTQMGHTQQETWKINIYMQKNMDESCKCEFKWKPNIKKYIMHWFQVSTLIKTHPKYWGRNGLEDSSNVC